MEQYQNIPTKDRELPRLLQVFTRYKRILLWTGIYLMLVIINLRSGVWLTMSTSLVVTTGMYITNRLTELYFIPKLLRTHKTGFYYGVSFLMIFLLSMGIAWIEKHLYLQLYEWGLLEIQFPGDPHKLTVPFFRGLVLLMSSFIVTTISFLLANAKQTADHNAKLKNEKLDMELRYLKAQINPHFLFNALNNIYALVYTGDEQAAESVLKLSEMLRYVTDDCQTETIALDKELKYIDNYIEFQLMSMEARPNLTFKKEIESSKILFPPMIFQPVIENCFKYARLENDGKGFINISLQQHAKQLIFETENSIAPSIIQKSSKRDGVGLLNVQKHLQLAFPGNYTFEAKQTGATYTTYLKIDLP